MSNSGEPISLPSSDGPMRERLDIVRDCNDLRGTFPQNVELKFAYWTHGSAPDGPQEAALRAERLAPHLMNADRIGFEMAVTAHSSPKDVAKEFTIINSVIANRNPRKRTYEDFYKGFTMTTAMDDAEAIVLALRDRGRDKPPVFFPFDVCEPWDTTKIQKNSIGNIGEVAMVHALELRWRESTTLRQLHSQARKLGHDGKPHQIAVRYGSAHSLTSVAARELGARTSRVFVDKFPVTPTSTLARHMRFHEGEDFSAQTAEADQAKLLGNLLWPLAESLGIKDPTQEPGRSERITMSAKLGNLILIAGRELLLGDDQTSFMEAVKVLTPFISYGTKVPITKRRSARAALLPLVDLADRLY